MSDSQTSLNPVAEAAAPRDGLAVAAKPDSLTDVVYEAIRDAIVDRVLPPGARVTEADLAAQLNVSKTPVREALLKLRQIGLIEPYGRRGGRIPMPSRTSIQHAYETREALEGYAAHMAAARGSARAKDAIGAAARRCLDAAGRGDLPEFRAWDAAFHDAVAEAAGNPRLAALIHDAVVLVTALRRRDAALANASVACARAHVEVVDAIANGDAERAAARMQAHIRQVEGYVLASLAEE